MTTRHYGPDNIKEVTRIEIQESAWQGQQAGEALSQYQVVFRDGDFWKLTDAHDPTRVAAIGVGLAQDGVSSGATGLDVWFRGLIENEDWALASGQRVFMGSGQGNLVTSAPTVSGDYVQLLGRALTTTILNLNPQELIRIAQ